LFIGRNSQL